MRDLEVELRKAQSQRDDFRRQLTAEREGRMLAERIVDEVRARNRELQGALDALVDLAQAVGQHPDAMLDDAPLAAPFVKAVAELRKHIRHGGELTNVTEHVVNL